MLPDGGFQFIFMPYFECGIFSCGDEFFSGIIHGPYGIEMRPEGGFMIPGMGFNKEDRLIIAADVGLVEDEGLLLA